MQNLISQSTTTIAGATKNPNILTGTRYERAPVDCMGSLFINGSAAGLTVEVNVGGLSISEPVVVNVQNRMPVIPDDVLIPGFECPEGALIQVTLTNTTASTSLVAQWKLMLEPIEQE
jgi:hypothetical protein